LHDAEEFVGTQPKRFPNIIIFACNPNRLVSAEIEPFDRGLRAIPVFALVLRATVNIHQQRRGVGRNAKSIAAVHACVSQDLRELPFLQNLSVEIDLVNVVQIVTENRFCHRAPIPVHQTLRALALHSSQTGTRSHPR
jgi:CRISPR/Cas system-associated endonuclease Cas3-HD